MDNSPIQPPEAKTTKRFPALVLTIGFLPLLLLLMVIVLPILFTAIFLPGKRVTIEDLLQPITPDSFLLAACAFSIVCGIVSSVVLFRMKSRVAIIGGVALLLLNLAISACLGFGALLILSFAY
jgi:hypothetical protein